jgi:hypothetical protein
MTIAIAAATPTKRTSQLDELLDGDTRVLVLRVDFERVGRPPPPLLGPLDRLAANLLQPGQKVSGGGWSAVARRRVPRFKLRKLRQARVILSGVPAPVQNELRVGHGYSCIK